MKQIFNEVWDFFVAWGEYRYQVSKRRGHAVYW
jgi:hypothetical protein